MEKIILTDPDVLRNNFEDFVDGKKKGMVELPVPVANICEWRGHGQLIYPLLLNISVQEMEEILYYKTCLVVNDSSGTYKAGDIIPTEGYESDDHLTVLFGMDAIEHMFESVDEKAMLADARSTEQSCMATLERSYAEERKYMEEHTEEDTDEAEERFLQQREPVSNELYHARAVIDACCYYRKHGLSRLVIRRISLFSLNLRSILKEERKSLPYAVLEDIETLCVRIIMRASRLSKLQQLDAPQVIILNESRMLQEYTDTLLANGKWGHPSEKASGIPYASLEDIVIHSMMQL